MSEHMHNNVTIGKESDIGPFVELGVPPKGRKEGDLALIIGDHATIRSHTVIYAGATIGDYFSTGHGAVIQTGVQVGDNVSVGSGSEIEHGVTIGSRVRIHSHCFIAQGTVIEDNVRISPGLNVTSTKHPLLPEDKKNRQGPHIEEEVYIGIAVTLIAGIKIGRGSFIGAGAIVTKDVPAGMVVIGNPARVHMSVQEYLEKLRSQGFF